MARKAGGGLLVAFYDHCLLRSAFFCFIPLRSIQFGCSSSQVSSFRFQVVKTATDSLCSFFGTQMTRIEQIYTDFSGYKFCLLLLRSAFFCFIPLCSIQFGCSSSQVSSLRLVSKKAAFCRCVVLSSCYLSFIICNFASTICIFEKK